MFRLNMFKSKLIIWIVHIHCLLLDAEQVTAETEILCSPEQVKAVCGSNIVLQCHLEPQQDVTHNTVKWSQQNDVVHVHQGGKDIPGEQSERFEYRTSLFSEGLSRGNLSLLLSHLKLGDSGRYKCFFQAGSVEKSCYIALSVGEYEVMGSSEPVTAESGQDVILPCQLKPPFNVSALTVMWERNKTVVHSYRDLGDNPDEQDQRFKNRTFLFRDEMVHGSFSLKLSNVTEEDAGIYTCSVPEPTCLMKRANVTLNVVKKEEDPDKRGMKDLDLTQTTPSPDLAHQNGRTIGLGVGIPVLVLLLLIAGVVLYKWRRQGQEAVPQNDGERINMSEIVSNQNPDDQDGPDGERDNNQETEPLNELNQDNNVEAPV